MKAENSLHSAITELLPITSDLILRQSNDLRLDTSYKKRGYVDLSFVSYSSSVIFIDTVSVLHSLITEFRLTNCKKLFAILGLSNDLDAITSIACTPLACLSSFGESLFPAFATNRSDALRFTPVHTPMAT